MYRADHDAALARLAALDAKMAREQGRGQRDQEQIARLTAELQTAQRALAALGHSPMPYPASYGYASRSGTILTLGILSVVLCAVMGPIAWSMGNEELRRIDTGQAPPYARGSVQAGRILGIVSSALLLLSAIIFAAAVAAT